eukprot:c33200_g1_i1 orf=2-178(-)
MDLDPVPSGIACINQKHFSKFSYICLIWRIKFQVCTVKCCNTAAIYFGICVALRYQNVA